MSIDNDVCQALEICKGDAMAALRMVLVANAIYEEKIRRLKQEASAGYNIVPTPFDMYVNKS